VAHQCHDEAQALHLSLREVTSREPLTAAAMAANYWDSTQAKYWTFTKDELAAMRHDLQEHNKLLHSKHPLPERRHMNVFLQQRKQCLVSLLGMN